MDVEVHRRGDVGVPKNDADGLDRVLALAAARGEAMPHPVELQLGCAEFLQRLFIVVFICPWFYG